MNALQVKVLYVRNLMLSTTEHSLERLFTDAVVDKLPSYSPDGAAGSCAVIERVKKIRDFAFIHFRDRELALTAMDRLNGQLTSQTITRYVCTNKAIVDIRFRHQCCADRCWVTGNKRRGVRSIFGSSLHV